MLRAFFLSGLFSIFFINAYAVDSLSCEGRHNRKGEKNGVWACKKNGQLVKREKYKNGVLKGYVIFNEKGQVIETRNRRGKVKKYNPCGC
jgi:hypothetical protein